MTVNEWHSDPHPTRAHMNGYTDPALPTARYRVPTRPIPAGAAVPRAHVISVGGTAPPMPTETLLRRLEEKQGYPRRRLAHGWRSHLRGTVLAAATLIGMVVLVILLVLAVLAVVWGLGWLLLAWADIVRQFAGR